MLKTLALTLLLAAPAGAATITAGAVAPTSGQSVTLDTADFAPSGPCGTGFSVRGDGCSTRFISAAENGYFGRSDPRGQGWIDSQDLTRLDWTVRSDIAFTRLSFALTDAGDMPNQPAFGGLTYFNMAVDGTTWTLDGPRTPRGSLRRNGSLYWIDIVFDEAVTETVVAFSTRQNDGFGVASASVAPIPLPAAGWMLLAGLAGLIAMRRTALKPS